MKKTIFIFAFALLTAGFARAQEQSVIIDAAKKNGDITHGAIGFLYGLGDPGIPSQQMLSALHPVTAAQKAPDGIQHPNGDALETAEQFIKAGGKEIQIYMQDIYKEWPYENLGMADYLPKIREMVKKGMNSPYKDSFVWIPLNEPDVIWYNNTSLLKSFLADWKRCYLEIKDCDPSARIAGPNTTVYNERFFDQFLAFAKENDCLPQVITWHELQNDFYTDWEAHYSSYRNLEKKYGIKPIPITINEYARFSGDLAMPGKLVQFISRFEQSGVNGCLAYWTTAGSLNDLVTHNNYPTGAWWLYYWYSQMTGSRLAATVQNPHAEGLQALASYDKDSEQIRVILGGSKKASLVRIQSLPNTLSDCDVLVKKTESSGLEPSLVPSILAPKFQQEGSSLTVSLPAGHENDAYLIILAPKGSLAAAQNAGIWDFSANAERIRASSAECAAQVYESGYYQLRTNVPVSCKINSEETYSVNDTLTLFLGEGINLFTFTAANQKSIGDVRVSLRKVAKNDAKIAHYNASDSSTEMSRQVSISKKNGFAEQKRAINESQFLTFTKIAAEQAGIYAVTVRYQNGELGSGASNYNTNIVDRSADILVNGKKQKTVFFRNTLGWEDCYTVTFHVELASGENSISFVSQKRKMIPSIDWIQVAPFVKTETLYTENMPPVVQNNVAFDLKATVPFTLSLRTNDDESTPLAFSWGTKSKELSLSNSGKPEVTVTALKEGSYSLTCAVSDGKDTTTREVQLRVFPEGLYEAESEDNFLAGAAVRSSSAKASGGGVVGYIGLGDKNTLTVNKVRASKNGTYTLTIYYISGEDRMVTVTANGKSKKTVRCPSTGDWTTVGSVSVKIKLQKGENALTFGNETAYAPDIDCIAVK
ncbi:MAG: carbohydrate-binding protein [Treponema sp.]|nr:carbohydrate-binding protein [Treponema sp.]